MGGIKSKFLGVILKLEYFILPKETVNWLKNVASKIKSLKNIPLKGVGGRDSLCAGCNAYFLKQ